MNSKFGIGRIAWVEVGNEVLLPSAQAISIQNIELIYRGEDDYIILFLVSIGVELLELSANDKYKKIEIEVVTNDFRPAFVTIDKGRLLRVNRIQPAGDSFSVTCDRFQYSESDRPGACEYCNGQLNFGLGTVTLGDQGQLIPRGSRDIWVCHKCCACYKEHNHTLELISYPILNV